MGQLLESIELRTYPGAEENITWRVEHSQMAYPEEGTVGVNGAQKLSTLPVNPSQLSFLHPTIQLLCKHKKKKIQEMDLKSFSSALLIAVVITAVVVPRSVFAGPVCTGIDKECGDSLSAWIVKAVGFPPTDNCCKELLKFGKSCHDQYVQINVKAKSYVGTLDEFLKRADETWRECILDAAFVPPPFPPLEV
ncbi:hypothetical protein MLD38_017998 [Melastoma candidum]|uniref:Uncharacterized protein n=1 Tax=Melastoma candidum TaxID=119954 RepID=A0ACB9QWI4_9MYRT|nr:hypothetical protein MLD38_017998 [Melastoma candidum]